MDSRKKANLLVIFLVAILALGISNIVALFTEDYINLEMTEINNQSQKLVAVDDGNFAPNHINTVEIDNDTNDTNNTSTDIIDNINSSDTPLI